MVAIGHFPPPAVVIGLEKDVLLFKLTETKSIPCSKPGSLGPEQHNVSQDLGLKLPEKRVCRQCGVADWLAILDLPTVAADHPKSDRDIYYLVTKP